MHNLLKDVTIIVPIFVTTPEALGWLKECLASAFAQKCNVVIYDDGSTLDLEPVLGIYLHEYKFAKSEHYGVSHARNMAINIAKTDLILPLDCDDRLKPNAISELLEYWNRYHVPIYPDVTKFGDINVAHYPLLDFACDHIKNHVGFTSVNVLHSKAMWKQIGGYDESLDFYEDGEYNARLLGTFCGVRCPKPLVNYRIHANQRTNIFKSQSAKYAKQILEKVRNYSMPCPGCGKRRTASLNKIGTVSANRNTTNRNSAIREPRIVANLPNLNVVQDPNLMSVMNDKGELLAQYIGGKGRGKHWYRGISTGTGYRVKYGLYLYVDKTDVKDPGDTTGHSSFVRVVRPAPKVEQAPIAVVEPPKMPTPVRTAVKPVAKTPVWQAPDIAKMKMVDIMNLELTPAQAAVLLEQEETGRTRAKVIAWLTLKADEK